MLVGGDLGFLSSLVAAAFVAVFGPVLSFVVRRKWRRSVARREEIKRLLDLVSEEAARVEVQAVEEYGYGYGYRYESVKDDDAGNISTGIIVSNNYFNTIFWFTAIAVPMCGLLFSNLYSVLPM